MVNCPSFVIEREFMLRFLSYIFFTFILFSHVTVFSQIEETSGYVFIEFARDYLEDKQEKAEEIITPYLQSDIIKRTEGWTVEEARNFLRFLLENIGPEETIKSIKNGFHILDFQEVSYTDFTRMVDIFVEHIGKEGLSIKILRRLESGNDMMPNPEVRVLEEGVENIEHIILFIEDYVGDENTAIEIIINNDLDFVSVDKLEQVLKYLEEQGFTKTDIIELMKSNLSSLNIAFTGFREKISFLLEYGFPRTNILGLLGTGQLDEISLEELKEITRYLEDAGLEKETIINVMTKNLAKLSDGKLAVYFFDLKEVMRFLEDYIGREGVHQIASGNFMFFYNIIASELKQLAEVLEDRMGRTMLIQLFYDLSLFDHYGSSAYDNITSELKQALNVLTQTKQMNDSICLMALTSLSVSYNLPIQNKSYFHSIFFYLRMFMDHYQPE